MDASAAKPFLTADWRHLLMLNYPVDEACLRPLLPTGTELDRWDGEAYISMVGFLFLNTRVLGVPIPFHRNFEEVNLRFYVRHKSDNEWRRGVVFVKEIVRRRAIAVVARGVYSENYVALPMGHTADLDETTLRANARVGYNWGAGSSVATLFARAEGKPILPAQGSQEEFIAEHYWGYTAQRDGGTKEYHVEHPAWRVWSATDAEFHADIAPLYGDAFVEGLSAQPNSAFVAEGSPVTVYRGVRL